MRVVIVGSRNRSEKHDAELVNNLIAYAKEKYSNLIIVVASCDKGIGRIVKARNLKSKQDPEKGNYEFDMIEVSLRHYLQYEAARQEFTSHWTALNSTIVDLGDEFHLLTDEIAKGSMFDLINKVKATGKPMMVYKPSEKSTEVKTQIADT